MDQFEGGRVLVSESSILRCPSRATTRIGSASFIFFDYYFFFSVYAAVTFKIQSWGGFSGEAWGVTVREGAGGVTLGRLTWDDC